MILDSYSGIFLFFDELPQYGLMDLIQTNISKREHLSSLLRRLSPIDSREKEHIQDVIRWLASDFPIYRQDKPDIPNKHLVSYFVIVDPKERKLLLGDHKKSGLWLPTGGHVDEEEDPKDTAIRECIEELGIKAPLVYEYPIFITVMETIGPVKKHTDVSLWYLMQLDSSKSLHFDRREYITVEWFDINSIPTERVEPNLKRFLHKLITQHVSLFE